MSVTVDHQDIWLNLLGVNSGEYRAQIGCGGAISNLLRVNGGQNLLSPSFQGEKTDRIIQWTLWSESLTHEVPGLPEFEYRYNLTQGGDFRGHFSELRSAKVLEDHPTSVPTLEIYGTPEDQWKQKQQEYFHGGVNSYTRYQLTEPGVIKVSRVLQAREITEGDATKNIKTSAQLGQVYLEGWTPLNTEVFNGIIFSLDQNSQPLWYYNLENLPTYPNFRASETKGYVIAGDLGALGSGTTFALIYGLNPLKIYKQSEHRTSPTLINTMPWGSGFGLLPGLSIPDWKKNGILVCEYDLIVNQGLTPQFRAKVELLNEQIPAPCFYESEIVAREIGYGSLNLDEILATFEKNNARPPVRLNHLAPLLSKQRVGITSALDQANFGLDLPSLNSTLDLEETGLGDPKSPQKERIDYEYISPLGKVENYCCEQLHKLAKITSQWWNGKNN